METINLKKLLNNINAIRTISKCDVLVVAKANCYNLGFEVIDYLVSNKINSICFNDISELLELTKSESNKKTLQKLSNILIFNSVTKANISSLYDYNNVIVSINNLSDIKNLNDYCYLTKIRVNLQIDTGMNRVGINSEEEFRKILEIIKYNPKFKVFSIYSHIANDINHQKEVFNNYICILNEYHIKDVKRHLYASKYYKEKPLYDLVRIGIDLYGDGEKDYIEQVVEVKCQAINIISLNKGDKLGYNESYISNGEIIAVLPIGYYNGFDRRLVGYSVYANGHYYEIVSSICMNHMFIRCDSNVTKETKFEIIGKNNTLSKMAKYLNTVPSEILTRLNIPNKKYIK